MSAGRFRSIVLGFWLIRMRSVGSVGKCLFLATLCDVAEGTSDGIRSRVGSSDWLFVILVVRSLVLGVCYCMHLLIEVCNFN